jgi:hypothetical protein
MARHTGIGSRACALLRDSFAATKTSPWNIRDIPHHVVAVLMANFIWRELKKTFSDGLTSAALVCRVYPSNYV